MKYVHEIAIPDQLKVLPWTDEKDLLDHLDHRAAYEIGMALIASGEIVRTRNVERDRITWTLNTHQEFASLAARYLNSPAMLSNIEYDQLYRLARKFLDPLGT